MAPNDKEPRSRDERGGRDSRKSRSERRSKPERGSRPGRDSRLGRENRPGARRGKPRPNQRPGSNRGHKRREIDPNSGSGSKPSYDMKLVATCALGLELPLGREIEAMGLGPARRDNAQVSFPYTPKALAKANYWLRTADRIWLQLAEFPCRDFEELFQGVKGVDWPSMLPREAKFPVEGISTKSKLESVPACQSVAKKAVVDRMRATYGPGTFPETGPEFTIRVFIVKNRARVFIDSSGEGLHRRGYRTYNAKAPLRETVAASLVLLSHWSPERELYDPMCGSGTILLEAASIGLKKANGCERSFASQRWAFLGKECWQETHQEALDLFIRKGQLKLYGSDCDPKVLKLARTHLYQSGLEGRGLYFQQRDVSEFSSQRKYGVLITNPPYGHRMNTREEVQELTKTMAQVFEPLAETWSLYYYTALENFGQFYGREPERVRKIYNGRIPACLLQYPGPKPPESRTFGGTPPPVKRIPLKP